MIDLNKLSGESQEIARKRAEHGLKADTLTCLKHCAGEVVEATEAFCELQCATKTEFALGDYFIKLCDEISDVIICALIVAANEGIDIEKAIVKKIAQNRKRAEGTGDKL